MAALPFSWAPTAGSPLSCLFLRFILLLSWSNMISFTIVDYTNPTFRFQYLLNWRKDKEKREEISLLHPFHLGAVSTAPAVNVSTPKEERESTLSFSMSKLSPRGKEESGDFNSVWVDASQGTATIPCTFNQQDSQGSVLLHWMLIKCAMPWHLKKVSPNPASSSRDQPRYKVQFAQIITQEEMCFQLFSHNVRVNRNRPGKQWHY